MGFSACYHRFLTVARLLGVGCFCVAGSIIFAQQPSSFEYTKVTQAFDRRDHYLHQARLDLSSPDQSIRVFSPRRFPRAKEECSGLELLVQPSVTVQGPLIHEGKWAMQPANRWSAAGFSRGNDVLFASNFFSSSGQEFGADLITRRGKHLPISLNSTAESSVATLFTAELSNLIAPKDPSAFWASFVLEPHQRSFATGAPTKMVVAKTEAPPQGFMLQDEEAVLLGFDSNADLLRQQIRHGDSVQVVINTPPEWQEVQEAIGLGLPLIWRGEAVQPNKLAEEVRPLAEPLAPSLPVLASFPRDHSLRVIWSLSRMQPQTAMTRRSLTNYLLNEGAEFAVEFASNATPIAVEASNPERSAALLNPAAGPALAIMKKDDGEEVNLCRLAGATAFSGTMHLDAGACIDGRAGEAAWPDGCWSAPALDSDGDPLTPWIEIDLNRIGLVSRIEILHAGTCGFSPQFNTSSFRLLGKETPSDSFRELIKVGDNHEDRSEVILPKSLPLRFLRLEIIKVGAFATIPSARIAEIEAWGLAE